MLPCHCWHRRLLPAGATSVISHPTQIARRRRAHQEKNPDANIISLGIGDTTEPIPPFIVEAMKKAAEGLGTLEGYSGCAGHRDCCQLASQVQRLHCCKRVREVVQRQHCALRANGAFTGPCAAGLQAPVPMSPPSCSYGAEQGQGPVREAICKRLYEHTGRKPSEIFVSDGSKCDIGRLQMMFGADVTVALQVWRLQSCLGQQRRCGVA